MKKGILLTFVIATLFAFSSCTEEGLGGKSSITGHVKHHDEHIPNALVYIKYGATELPGTDPSAYDDQTMASAGDGQYEFEGLQEGSYYLFSVGYDSLIFENVKGGISVELKKGEAFDINIPVTE